MRIREGIPDCVPEWSREQEEREARKAYLEGERRERYRRNREKVEAAVWAGRYVIPYDGHPECRDCRKQDGDTQTDEDDDIGAIICLDDHCPCHKKYGDKRLPPDREPQERDNEMDFELEGLELLEELSVESVRKFARVNYEKGGDIIEECLSDREIQELIRKGAGEILLLVRLQHSKRLDIESTIW